MKLGFFTMPVHPTDRPWADTLREDQEAFLLADELGYTEAYVGEHTTDAAEAITSCVAFLASLSGRIKQMRLGTGTVNLPNAHPAAVASQVAMLDQMLGGKFNFGISPGGLLSDAEVFGNLDANRQEMFLESINTILAIWEGEPPYNIEGKYWKISTERTMMPEIGQGFIGKPLQKPYPPIVVTAVAPFSKGVTAAAARGWDPISANFLMPKWVATHRNAYLEGCAQGGRPGDLSNWRVAKSVFVADDMATAREYARGAGSSYVFYYKQLLTKMVKNGRVELFKESRDQPDSEVTLEGVLDKLVIYGTPDKVADDILAFREEVGAFGTLLYAGKDWRVPEMDKKSMRLMAEEVMPRINAALPRDQVEAAE